MQGKSPDHLANCRARGQVTPAVQPGVCSRFMRRDRGHVATWPMGRVVPFEASLIRTASPASCCHPD
jgi:hypothetical protein